MKRSSWLLVLMTLLIGAALNADTLILRDGRRLEGQLISVQNGVLDFDAQDFGGGRVLRFNRAEVLGIEFDRNDRNVSRNPQQSAPAGGRSGLRERQVMVAANMRWIDTNVDVQSGQTVYFE